ncbi:LysR family transcriptional regulator [Brockia lithotrophica]|uniref:LysR family transcriptional regulator n=2 Tax=Brockia lithotrophica TaxID=933949 RepID=A0A660L8F4_9BACL|nr:LysR family transcriptional regulator [Brockia lithotrophica]
MLLDEVDFRTLRVFLEVAATGSMSRAAQALYLAPSTVSEAVRQLEGALGVRLFVRGTRGVALTKAGEAWATHVRDILERWDAALGELSSEARDDLSGVLSLAASRTVGEYLLPRILPGFLTRHPGIDVRLLLGNTEEAILALERREAVGALVEGDVPPRPTLRKVPVLLDVLTFAAPVGGREICAACRCFSEAGGLRLRRRNAACRTWKEDDACGVLARARWLVREPGSGTRALTEGLWQALGILPVQTLTLGSMHAILEGVAAGLGVALLPERVLASSTVRVAACRPLTGPLAPRFVRRFHLVTRLGEGNLLLSAFARAVRASAEEERDEEAIYEDEEHAREGSDGKGPIP